MVIFVYIKMLRVLCQIQVQDASDNQCPNNCNSKSLMAGSCKHFVRKSFSVLDLEELILVSNH